MTALLLSLLSFSFAGASAFAFYETGRAFASVPHLRRGRDICLVLASLLLIASLVTLP